MKLFLSIILVVLSFTAFGQNHFLGVKGGLNSTKVSIDVDWDNSFRKGFLGGFTYQYDIDQHFFINNELLYEERGYKSKTFFSFVGHAAENGDEVIFRYDYISLPLKFGYKTHGNLSGHVCVGMIPAYLLKAEHYIPWELEQKNFDVTDLAQRFDFAGVVELGGSYTINPNLLFSLSLAYQHSFTTISQNGYFEDNTVRNFGISLSGGIKYALKRK